MAPNQPPEDFVPGNQKLVSETSSLVLRTYQSTSDNIEYPSTVHICLQKHFRKQPLPNRILHLCSKTTIWNGLKNCLVLAILTSSIQGVYTEGEDSMIKTELLKVFFVFFFFAENGVVFHHMFCVTVRSPYLVTSTPYHPPPRQKRSNASVSFHPKALRSKSTPSIARDRWVTAVKSSGTHTSPFSENVVSLLPSLLLQVLSTCVSCGLMILTVGDTSAQYMCVLWADDPYCWWQ